MNALIPGWTEQALLVYGPKKGGTTMLQNLLDDTQDILMYPREIKFKLLQEVAPEELSHTFVKWAQAREYRSHAFNHEQYQTRLNDLADQTVANLKELLQREISILHENVLSFSGTPQLWGMKEVGGHPKSVINGFLDMFEHGKIVLIVRNPLQVVRSIVRNAHRREKDITAKKIFMLLRQSSQFVCDVMNYRDHPRVCMVAYEMIVNRNATEEMKRVATFLGLEYREAFEKTTIFGEDVVARTSSKQVSSVFSNAAPWHAGLGWTETLSLGYAALSALFRKDDRKRAIWRYNEILDTLYPEQKGKKNRNAQ